MRLVARTAGTLVFHLGTRERVFFERLLSFYPLRPDESPTLSRGGANDLAAAEELLAESLRERREESAAWLKQRLGDGGALRPDGDGWRLELSAAEVERLLQVLNELRVGAWEKLGCPEDLDSGAEASSPGGAPLHAIMTVAGQIQMAVLHAWWGDVDSGEGGGGT